MNGWFARLLGSVLFGFTTAAAATLINFTYTGIPACTPPTCTDELSGSFAFADSPLSVALADLTAFSLTYTFTDSSVPEADTWIYSLTDLQSFSATFDAAQKLLALSFKTDQVLGTTVFLGELGVQFTSISPPSATLETCAPPPKAGAVVCSLESTGSLTTSVPEPSILALLSIGLGITGIGYAGIGYERLKRRASRSMRALS